MKRDAQCESSAAVASDERSESIRELARWVLREETGANVENLWTEFLDGEWSPVDHFDDDGRRYLIARPRRDRGPLLTLRERQVLARRARGEMLESIALDCGISISNVSRTLAAGMKKLGIASHIDLVRLLGASR